MTKTRLRAPGYFVTSKSRYATTRYGSPVGRRPVGVGAADYYPTVISKVPSYDYDTHALNYFMGDAVSRASSISAAAIDDTYDSHAKSRGKDKRLLMDATSAIVSSETHSSPRAAVASRRAAGRTRPPMPSTTSFYKSTSTVTQSLPPRVVQRPQVVTQQQPKASAYAPTIIWTGPRSEPGFIVLSRPDISKFQKPPPVEPVYRSASPVNTGVVVARYKAARVAPLSRAQPPKTPIQEMYLPPVSRLQRPFPVRRVFPRVLLRPGYRKYVPQTAQRVLVPKRALPAEKHRPPYRKHYHYNIPRRLPSPKSTFARVLRAVLWGEPMVRFEPALLASTPVAAVKPLPAAVALLLQWKARGLQSPPASAKRPRLFSVAPTYPRYRKRKPRKAAIVASKVEVDEPKRRRPRSKFAAEKLRSIQRESKNVDYNAIGASAVPPQDKPVSELRRRLRRVIARSRNDPNYYRE